MASHISPMTQSRPRPTSVPVVSFSSSLPSVSTAAMRRLVPPRSTPMEYTPMCNLTAPLANYTALLLTARTIMTAPSCDDNPLDGGAARQAGIALSAVHAMSQLEETLRAFRSEEH